MSDTVTLEQLTALSDPELSVLAARKIHGWQVSYGTWEERGNFTRCHLYESPEGAVMPVDDYSPATDRNQSGELLRVVAARQWQFWIAVDNNGTCSEVTGISHGALLPEVHVPGNTARSETLAALMAAFAVEDSSNA